MGLGYVVGALSHRPSARQPAEAYLNHHGIPIKLVKAADLDEMKGSLTGRDAKVLIADAGRHIPALLHFAHAGGEAVEASAAQPECVPIVVNDATQQTAPIDLQPLVVTDVTIETKITVVHVP